MPKRIPRTRAERTAWANEAEQKCPIRFRFGVLALAAFLMVAHYAIDELGYHPEVSLWRARAFWSSAWMCAAAPFVNWTVWRLLSAGRLKALKPIFLMSVVLCVGSALAFCVPNILRSTESLHLHQFDPSIDNWHWFAFRFYWDYWTTLVLGIGDLILLWRWSKITAKSVPQPCARKPPTASRRGVILKIMAITSVAATCGVMAIYLVLPRLPADGDILSLARAVLVEPRLRSDFDFLIQRSFSAGQPLAPLLAHVKLADRQRHQFYSNLSDSQFQEYVLSLEIAPLPLAELDWRQTLWGNFYPQVRHESDPRQAACIVLRLLRERVGIDPSYDYRVGVETIWTQQMTDETGFERIYVAALRSIGVASRLGESGQAELLYVNVWQPAPRPVVSTFEPKKFPVPQFGLVNFRNWAGDDWPSGSP